MNYILTLSFIFFFLSIQSQSIKLRILDENDEPLSNAYIEHTNTVTHYHSDAQGMVIVPNVSSGNTLLVSYLGYENYTVFVDNNMFDQTTTISLKEASIDLDQVRISVRSKPTEIVSSIDVNTNPVNTSQELLRTIPGLIIGQHAGGGKAEQIFLRGFDIDHGTDIAISVDGMPVNMVSHAHGQGYADMHFIIPETVDDAEYGKGPYAVDQGNFATAGYIDFRLKDKLPKSYISAEIGEFGYIRNKFGYNIIQNEVSNAYVAAEYTLSDGPFQSSQNFNRLNVFLRHSTIINGKDKLTLSLGHFDSKWLASGQVPDRAVASGLIDRFGAIDDTEGGNTSRTNIMLAFNKYISPSTTLISNAYFAKNKFDLYSNFTFFLNDPVYGDQIRQYENRNLFGFQSKIIHSYTAGEYDLNLSASIGMRNDQTLGTSLSATYQRDSILNQIQLGDVFENNMFATIGAEIVVGNLAASISTRYDRFQFNYINSLLPNNRDSKANNAAFSPKLSVSYTPSPRWQVFANLGRGFHSNDTRLILDNRVNSGLPAADGIDVGFMLKPLNRLILNATAWLLHLDQEFVYVGDGGIVEPSGQTLRQGVEVGARYQLPNEIFFNSDVSITKARSTEEADGNNFIPLAPGFIWTAGLSKKSNHFTYGLRFRHVAERPANEDNSIIARPYSIFDANISYKIKNIELGLVVENLLNTEWDETQFATESRLFNELESVEEIHFTPGFPRFIKGTFKYLF